MPLPTAPEPTVSVTTASDHQPTSAALLLGYSGLLPFLALAAAAWLLEQGHRLQIQFALLTYGASIVSFLGAIHWGLALREPQGPPTAMLVWAVVPSLLAWMALLLGANTGLLMLVAILWLCFAVDRRGYPRHGLRGWLGMRLTLTSVASASCLLAAWANR